jgi:multidrug efflux pump subunit AcrB
LAATPVAALAPGERHADARRPAAGRGRDVNLSRPFVQRPVGTLLLALGILLLGAVSYSKLPIASLPSVERPTITIYAILPGASADTIASSLAQPLETQLGIIPGIDEMVSFSATGGTSIVIQFDLTKDIDAAAGEVQAAINAAAPNLPKDLPNPPYYVKANPGGFSVVALALNSDVLPAGEVYDFADSVVVQKLSELPGVAQVHISGADRSGIRIRMSPRLLANMQVSMEQVRAAVIAATVNLPKGSINIDGRSYAIDVNDQAKKAADYRDVVVGYRNNAPVYLSDVATISDSVINDQLDGWFGDQRSVLAFVFKQPDANVVDIVDSVKALMPELSHWLPPAIKVHLLFDRTLLIRASIADVQHTLVVAIILVVLVIALFLKRLWATLIPGFTIPVVLGATIVVMAVAGYSLDNLSLMALTISIGFIVDDAVIVVENIARLVDEGNDAVAASLKGIRQMGFTIISITGTLLGALLPILFMPDVVGRYFSEFGVTLAAAIIASAIISLTLTPMLCSRLFRPGTAANAQSRRDNRSAAVALYVRSLDWALLHPNVVISMLVLTALGTPALYLTLHKGFMPTQDTGILGIRTVTTSNVSFDAMERLQRTVSRTILKDPVVEGLASYIGTNDGSPLNNGFVTVSLKPLQERKLSIDQVMTRLRGELAGIPGVRTFFKPWQDLQLGAENSASRYQYTLTGSDPDDLWRWSEVMRRQMLAMPELTDIITTAEVAGLEAGLTVDRLRASAFGVTQAAINNTLYDAFGQRQIATIYLPFSYSRVVLDVDPAFQAGPAVLRNMFVLGAATPAANSHSLILGQAAASSVNPQVGVLGAAVSAAVKRPSVSTNPNVQSPLPGSSVNAQVPLATITRPVRTHAHMWLRHSEQFPSITLSFDLRPGISIGEAITKIRAAAANAHLPDDIKAEFRGEAAEASKSWVKQALLFLAAVFTIYVVLGMLYESYVHAFTILSTLPSATFGALLALLLTQTEFTLVTAIACILVVGMVMKNAIMMVDFALAARRQDMLSARASIRRAARLRVRPIVMTTFVTVLSAIPIAVGTGPGHELRQPLGIATLGGLLVSQVLTLYTTPVIFLLVERLRARRKRPVMGGNPDGFAPAMSS